MSRFRSLVLSALVLATAAAPALAAPRPVEFPAGFMWGAATAAHQVEGGLDNDWMPWELEKGAVKQGHSAILGVEHYNRFDADFKLAAGMGHNAHRLSIEWSRIEPAPGRINWKEVDHYHAVFRSLKAHGMAPMVTLHHFTSPLWVAAQGGWLAERTQDDFARFAAFVGREYGKEVDHWITINEPNVYAFQSYDAGLWPPRRQNRSEALRVMANLMKGHGLAYRALHLADKRDADGDGLACAVGVANHWALFDPMSHWNAIEVATAYFNNRVFNHAALVAQTTGHLKFQIPGTEGVNEQFKPAESSVDFIGLNYYTRWMIVSGGPKERIPMPGAPVTDLGWEDYPEGLYRALKHADGYTRLPDGRRVPVIITENGLDDRAGTKRNSYLVRHLQQVGRAIEDGVPVRGYMHWTLMDNFEWAEGYEPMFGLFRIDRTPGQQLRRIPTPTVDLFKDITRNNGLTAEMLTTYGTP